MPDLQEVFRMATQKVRPDPEALERQHQKQRGKLLRERATVYALVAGLVAAGVAFGISTLRSSDEPAVPASQGPHPAWTNEQLAGVWVQTRAAVFDRAKVLTITTDGTFVIEAGDRPAYGIEGTYQVQGRTITFANPERGCPRWKWTSGGPAGPVSVLEFTVTDTGTEDCGAPFDEGLRLEFVRVSPRTSETDRWEFGSEFASSRQPGQPEQVESLRRVAGIWFQDDGEHVLRIARVGEYSIGVGEASLTDPVDTGTISFGDEGTIEFTSGPESRTCVEGAVRTWRDVSVNRYGMFVGGGGGDPCGVFPVGLSSWHNLIRY